MTIQASNTAICVGCDDLILTDQPYYELELRSTEDPNYTITVLCHPNCKVKRVKQ